ncbi:MAG: GIY-YIG nuclease family protein [Desulfoarculaceae bacterium]|nr:GIY-YIG nuclease family protein [Desulfoarculaceae bacterium]
MNSHTCKTCLHSRIDCIGQIFCAEYCTNFPVTHCCNQWASEAENTLSEQSNPGYVYILSNPDLPGLLKVGMTYKRPELRAKELSSTTGVSSKYVIEYYGKVADRFVAEKAAHNRLKNFHHKKEFFKVDIEVAIYCVETISSPIERAYITSGNEQNVLNYARKRDNAPYKQIAREWEARERELKRSNAELTKIKNWEEKVEDYMRKRTGKEESLFDYHKMPGNPRVINTETNQFKEDYDPNKIILQSEFARAEHKAKIAMEELNKKERENERLREELAKEKNKGFFKRLFS